MDQLTDSDVLLTLSLYADGILSPPSTSSQSPSSAGAGQMQLDVQKEGEPEHQEEQQPEEDQQQVPQATETLEPLEPQLEHLERQEPAKEIQQIQCKEKQSEIPKKKRAAPGTATTVSGRPLFPPSAFARFSATLRHRAKRNNGKKFTLEKMKQMWDELDAAEKKPYVDSFDRTFAVYSQRLKEYEKSLKFGDGSVGSTKKAKRENVDTNASAGGSSSNIGSNNASNELEQYIKPEVLEIKPEPSIPIATQSESSSEYQQQQKMQLQQQLPFFNAPFVGFPLGIPSQQQHQHTSLSFPHSIASLGTPSGTISPSSFFFQSSPPLQQPNCQTSLIPIQQQHQYLQQQLQLQQAQHFQQAQQYQQIQQQHQAVAKSFLFPFLNPFQPNTNTRMLHDSFNSNGNAFFPGPPSTSASFLQDLMSSVPSFPQQQVIQDPFSSFFPPSSSSFNPAMIFNDDGTMVPSLEMNDEQQRAGVELLDAYMKQQTAEFEKVKKERCV
ncbi:UNVERIFIED_CONTAM: hypothetical protein HDU68_007702 [Siphonaria sp. JEL0065]|nr:hypothetical protein HDU68_007702 [Siphonaria sp. JEL0065]